MASEKPQHAPIPTKHDFPPDDAIYTHIDFIANPVALVGDSIPDNFDGHLVVEGEAKVTVENGALLAKERDVFHALMTLVKRNGFEKPAIRFYVRDLLKLMGWDDGSWGYERFREAIDNLGKVSITIDGPRRWDFINIIGGASIARKPEATRHSRVEFSAPFWRLCKAQHFKALHPVLYQLPSGVAARMLELISVKASDLPTWRVDLLTLRDLIPLVGSKYRSPGRVKQNLEPALETFKRYNILFGYRFEPEYRPRSVVLEINSDYFYSRKFPSKRQPVASGVGELPPEKRELVELLVVHGVTRDAAVRLATQYPEDEVRHQVAHYDYLAGPGRVADPQKAPKGGGWFTDALRGRWTPPAGFREWRDRQRVEEEQRSAARRGEAMKEAIERFVAGLSAREHQVLEEEAARRLREGESSFLKEDFLRRGPASPAFRQALRTVIREKVEAQGEEAEKAA